MSFALELKQATRQAHTMAENVDFIRGFLRGSVDAPAYRRMLASFLPVYTAMEAGLAQHRAHPVVGALWFPQLHRRAALQADLTHLGRGPVGPASPATRAYVERIQAVTRDEPELLVAHCYVRYLGDLSGGQILARIAGRSLGLNGKGGLAFYDFPQIENPKAFKAHYRATLDALPLSRTQQQAVMAEAVDVFALNIALFREFEGSSWRDFWHILGCLRPLETVA